MLGSTASLQNGGEATKLPVKDGSARLRGCRVLCRCLEDVSSPHAGQLRNVTVKCPLVLGQSPDKVQGVAKHVGKAWGLHASASCATSQACPSVSRRQLGALQYQAILCQTS